MKRFEKAVLGLNYVKCRKCEGKLVFKGAGRYVCEDCGGMVMDDFGKIRDYIEKNGPKNAEELHLATGIKLSTVQEFLRQGRLEIPNGSEVFITCNKCGCDIRYGRYCPECAAHLAGGVKQAFLAGEVGERPRKKNGKMHFIKREEN